MGFNVFPPGNSDQGVSGIGNYADTIVVDPNGNGDYKLLSAAFAAEGGGKTYYVFGTIVDPLVVIDEVCQILGPGKIVGDLKFYNTYDALLDNPNLVLGGNIEIVGDIDVESDGQPCRVYIYRAFIRGEVTMTPTTTHDVSLKIYPGCNIKTQVVGKNCIRIVDTGNAGQGVLMIAPGSILLALADDALVIEDAAGVTMMNVLASLVSGAILWGATDAIVSTVALSPPVYLCSLINGVNANITLPAGSNNVLI